MNELKELIIKKLKENRPNITDSSIKTYVSNLVSVNKKLNGSHDLDFYKHTAPILKYIEEEMVSLQTKKTLLSALYIITQEKVYRDKMIEYCNQVNNKYKEQKLSDKQKDYRITFDEVKSKVEEALNNLKNNPTLENYKLYLASVFSSFNTIKQNTDKLCPFSRFNTCPFFVFHIKMYESVEPLASLSFLSKTNDNIELVCATKACVEIL